MAEKQKRRAQNAQDTQEAQTAPDFVLPSKDNMPAELAELMQLSFAEIEQLPEEKQQLVYAEIGRQAAGAASNIFSSEEIERILNLPKVAAETWANFTEKLDKAQKEWQRRLEAIQKVDLSGLTKAMRQISEVGPTLQPYIEKLCNADPERWKHANMPDVYAAAARAAREDGQEVPLLWCESQGEQLAMQLDIPGEQPAASKEENSLTPAELLETIKTVQAINPTAHVMPNNALMNALTQKPAINAGAFDLVVANEHGRRKEITNYTIVSYDPGQSGVKITDPKLSEYERQVSDAVISLWAAADKQKIPPVFTIDDIYQSMPGGGGKPSPAQRGAITKTMEKFARLHIYMDATEEMQRRRQSAEGQQFIVDEDYLNWRRYTAQTRNGRKITQGYELLGRPIMLTYSMLTNQTLTVNAEQLAIRKIKGGAISPELVSMSAGRQAMTGYMLRRIAVIKHDAEAAKDAYRQHEKRRRREPELEARPLSSFRKQNPVILFDTLFAEAGTATTDRKQAGLNRAFCYDVLEYWRATGFIKGYAEQRKGKKITGFSILL